LSARPVSEEGRSVAKKKDTPDSQVDQGVKDEPYKSPSLDRVCVGLEGQESAGESESGGEESDGCEEGPDGGRVQEFERRLVVQGRHLRCPCELVVSRCAKVDLIDRRRVKLSEAVQVSGSRLSHRQVQVRTSVERHTIDTPTLLPPNKPPLDPRLCPLFSALVVITL
jgi:hypothetical protein